MKHKLMLVASWLGLAGASGCGSDTISVYEVECDDDAIGWELDLAGLVELPLAEFGVECASGWGHGVETRAASEVIELPIAFEYIRPHPQGGLLLNPYGREELWAERLGIAVADGALMWLDEQAEQVRWLRDDLDYGWPFVVSGEAGTELWAWGYDEEQGYLSRIEPSTGELLERVVWAEEQPTSVVAAWPDVGGLWQMTREGYDEDFHYYVLQRMPSFAELGPVLHTFAAPRVVFEDGSSGSLGPPSLDPTPGGGLLYGYGTPLESLAEDGSQRWALDEPHSFRVVDQHGTFLLGNVDDGNGPDDQRSGLTLQRRSLDDGSLLWTRVHHRYEFARQPEPDEWLHDVGWSHVARAEGGYLIAGGHAYPASSCPWQPIIWAIDADGEVEWAHRVEACGSLFMPADRVEGRAMVLGSSYADGDGSNGNIEASWLMYFDL